MKKKVLGLVGTLEIEIRESEDTVLMRLSREIDVYTSEEIEKIVTACIDTGKYKIIVDLSNVTYLDSSGLSALINCKIRLSKRKGGLRLVGLNNKAKAVFELAGVITLFDRFDKLDDAIAGF